MLPVGFANLAKMFFLSDDSPFSILEDSASLHRYIRNRPNYRRRVFGSRWICCSWSVCRRLKLSVFFFFLRCLRALLVNAGQETDSARYCKYKFSINLVIWISNQSTAWIVLQMACSLFHFIFLNRHVWVSVNSYNSDFFFFLLLLTRPQKTS